MGKYGIWAALALATVVFYFVPLFDSQTSIQGDAADLHYPAQKYLADSMGAGRLPHWTPYLYSGFPFLSDPQTGAWYPLHWPFFLTGVTPRAIQWELALHAFLALCGTVLLARRLGLDGIAAVVAAVFYAGGGFFAGHSSHVGIFETAALLPWLLWSALRALEVATMPAMLLTGAIGGAMILIGNFQTAAYSFGALILLVIARRANWKRSTGLLTFSVAAALLLSAILILPAMELISQSGRPAAPAGLKLAALSTLVLPNFYGAISGTYSGPGDASQFYFYAGILLVPLAILAVVKKYTGIALIVPALLYAFVSIHVWFVAALGLALAAGSGAAWLAERFRKPWLITAVLVVTVADVWYWNMADNPLAYASASFNEKYGDSFANMQAHLAPIKERGLYRIWSPFDTNSFGPLNGSLNGPAEVTYGYDSFELSRYREYLEKSKANQRLLNGLAVTHGIDTQRGAIVENTNALPRIYAPPHVQFVASHAAARELLGLLDPAQAAIVEAPLRPLAPGPTTVEIVDYSGDYYRAKYSAPFDCLLRIAVPYFPGWTAAIDGKPATVSVVDVALSGVFAPAGDHELTFSYRSRWFLLGAAISGLTLIGIILSSILLARGR